MDSSECSDFPAKENIEEEDAELNKTECFEFNTQTKSETIQQKPQSSNLYRCEFCHYKSKNNHSVTRHEKSVHRKQKFPCDLCGYKATNQGYLTRHKQSKHEGIKHTCSKCDKKFTFKVALTAHIQSVHDGKKYQCQGCNYQATRMGDLNTHVKSKHTKQKYPCLIITLTTRISFITVC